MPGMMPRLAAAIIAIFCWIGLGIQFSASYADHVDLISTLWSLGRFFTILTNLLVAVTMTWVAIGGRPSVNFLGGVTLAIILVGVVYVTLLQGLRVLTGGHLIADILLHKVSPTLMALWWLLFAPRAKLRPRIVPKLPGSAAHACSTRPPTSPCRRAPTHSASRLSVLPAAARA